MSMHRLSGCPSCAEPLEEGDRFCGLCGHALTPPGPTGSAAPAAPGPAAAQAAPAGAAVPAPAAPPAPRAERAPDDGPVSRPSGATADGERTAPGYAVDPAPGWGSVSTAAPTLVAGHEGWAGTTAAPDPARPAHPAAVGTDPHAPYGSAPGGTASPGAEPHHPAGGTESVYGHAQPPGPAAGHEPPHAHAEPRGPGAADDPSRPDPEPRGPVPAGETRFDTPAPQDQYPAVEAPYGGPPEGVPHDGGRSAGSGKTCVACREGRVDTDGYCEHCGHAQPRERDHFEEELGSVAAVSDRGLRHHRNEDSFAVAATALPDGSAATVAIVCDGVSSASRPDEASAAAAAAANEALLEALPRGAHPQEAMHEAIMAASAAVNALAPEVPGAQNAPACTLVGAVVSGGLLTIGWVGDSRAYWVPDDRAAVPRRLTEDDSWAAQMVAAGLMGEAEAYADVRAHAITGWLGADAYDLEPHTATFKPDHDGVVVVCTDGLWNYAESARDIAQVLPADAAVRPLHSAQVLVGHALDGGGHDNVTVAVVPFAAPEGAAPGQA
ncbi:protein phosphatase 2C domain-containing protein [Streptomyces sp. NPDC006544]|uniref:protein phosphatase 2C domain-containing protein n=1 Tax=Streptomyces sp. NPDC006544 TaxID=3154583 RepID=UPI0033AC30E9